MSLYNEVRPTNLSEVVGQEKVVNQVRGILASGNVPNVSLFVGPRGTGKTTIARIYAKALNCSNPTPNGACNECESCKEDIDIIELDAASHNKVDDVHKIIDDAVFAPRSKYKIYIVDEVHMLSTAAFNALLKLLEEPPAYCRFILCTTEEHKVPVTILSRCRKFYFERIALADIVSKMKHICTTRNISFEEDALFMIAKKSEGCMRDAESLLEVFLDAGKIDVNSVAELTGCSSDDLIFGLLNSVADGNTTDAFNVLKTCIDSGKDLLVLIKGVVEALADTIYFIQSGKDLTEINATDTYKQSISDLANKASAESFIDIADKFGDVYITSVKGANPEFVIKAKIMSIIKSTSNTMSVEKRLQELEEECDALKNALYDMGETIRTGATTVAEETVVNSAPTPVAGEDSNPVETIPETIGEPIEENTTSEEDESSGNAETQNVVEKSIDDFFGIPSVDSPLPGEIVLPEGTDISGMISLLSSDTPKAGEDLEQNMPSEDASMPPVESKTINMKNDILSSLEDLGDIPIMGVLSGILGG